MLADGEVVGHVMWAYEPADGSHWIGGMVVDAAEQGTGVGRAALLATLAHLAALPGAQEIRLACHPDNAAAAGLYRSVGFDDTGEREDGDVVCALRIARPG